MLSLANRDLGALGMVAVLIAVLVWTGLHTVRGRPGFAPLSWLPAAVWSVLAGVAVAGLGALTDSADLGAFLLGVGGSMVGAGIVILAQGRG